MKQRFEYSFEDVESKLLRKGKGLKKKNKYSLKQAEGLIAWVQHNWPNKTEVTVMCKDTEDGAVYAFDGIEITPFGMGGEPIALFPIIEDQILQAPDNMINDPNKLILDINSQYQSEPDIAEAKQESKSKKGLNLPSVLPNVKLPFGKKKHLGETPESDQFFEEYETESTPELDEELELDEESEEVEAEIETDLEQAEETMLDETESFDFEEEIDMTTSSHESVAINSQTSVPAYSQNTYHSEQNYALSNSIPQTVRQIKKHETVQLTPLQEYCDLGEEIESSIVSTTNKLQPENLFKFIGIPAVKNTRLDEYRINHAMQRLAEVKFENLREHYSRQVNSMIAEALDKLREAIDVAWKKPYDLEVKKRYADILEEMETNSNSTLEEFEKRQYDMVDEKIKKFETEQEIALQNFIANQEAEKAVFIANEKERAQNLIDTKSETITSELEKRREEFIDEEMYKMKIDMNQNLFDGKRLIKQELAVELANANEDVWENALKFITEIQNEINEKTPLWASEIKETNILEQQAHQMQKEQQELKLKEESLAIKRLEAETNMKRLEELDHENKMLKIKLETANSKNELYEYEKETQQKVVGSTQARNLSTLGLFRK